MFTAAWLVLGWTHPGYSQVAHPISVLAAYGAPRGWVMTVAFVAQAAAMAVAGLVLRPRARWAGGLLLLNAAATLVVAAARIPCGVDDATWCEPSRHPTSYAVHVVAATVALVALTLAPLSAAVATGRRGDALLRTGPVVSVAMAGLLAWFAVAAAAGWAEKAVVTAGIWWAAAVAARVVGPGRHAGRTAPEKGPP